MLSAAFVDLDPIPVSNLRKKKGVRSIERWDRESLTPTGFPTLYTSAVTGTGASSIGNGRWLSMVTSANIGDDVSVRTSGWTFTRGSAGSTNRYFADPINSWEVDVIFAGPATDSESFVGLHSALAALTGLPTTARHLGIYADLSAGANFMLTSGNNSAQSTTDTGMAVTADQYRLNIQWTGDNAAVIRFYDSTSGFTNLRATHTVTSFGITFQAIELHFFQQTETTAAKTMEVYEWSATPR